MSPFLALLRKHLIESRWMLGISSGAFFALSNLTAWLSSRLESRFESGEIPTDRAQFGFLQALGGPEMDFSTTALEVCWWNHPLIILTVLAWAVSRGSNAVAGEIERGTIDLTLSRPISRSAFLASHVSFAVFGLLCLVAALIAGNQIGNWVYPLRNPPSVLTLLKPAAIIVTVGMAVFAYTVPFSALDVVRWRPTLASSAITLTGLVAMSFATQIEGYRWWLERLSVFHAYAPVTVALKGEPLLVNTSGLLVIFALGTALSFLIFARRDVPSNS